MLSCTLHLMLNCTLHLTNVTSNATWHQELCEPGMQPKHELYATAAAKPKPHCHGLSHINAPDTCKLFGVAMSGSPKKTATAGGTAN
jgi:hypothetical protein